MNGYSLQLIKQTSSIIVKFLFSCGFMSVTVLSHFPFYNNGFTLLFFEKLMCRRSSLTTKSILSVRLIRFSLFTLLLLYAT